MGTQCDAVFIFTPIDNMYQDALTHYAPSLGLVALENYLFSKGMSVDIIDGSVLYTLDEIIEWLHANKPHFVGQSVQLISYTNALKIASVVHGYGGINVLGGHHATQMADAIMENQKEIIDYVVLGDGELAWYGLLKDQPIDSIPNLVYSNNGVVYHNAFVELPLDVFPVLDYSRVDLTPYKKRLKESSFGQGVYTNYLRIYSHKGCGNRIKGVGCIFCGRADHNVRFKSAQRYWEEIRHCVNYQHADFIFDVGDDFLFSNNYLKELLLQKPSDLNKYDLGIFGRANRVTLENASILRKIGVKDVTIGFESGDADVLHNCNKLFASPEQNLRAVEYLAKAGIDITASYVLGMPGENANTIRNTIENAKRVVEISNSILGHPPNELVANLLEPSPGSPAFQRLVNEFPEKYYLKDKLDLEMMQRDYFRVFFNIDSYEDYHAFRRMLRNAANEIHSFVSFSDAQGWLADE